MHSFKFKSLVTAALIFLACSPSYAQTSQTGSSVDGDGNINFSIFPPGSTTPGRITFSPTGGINAGGDVRTGGDVISSGTVVSNGDMRSRGEITSKGDMTSYGNIISKGDITARQKIYALPGCKAGSLIVKDDDGSLGCTDPEVTGTPLLLRQSRLIIGKGNIAAIFQKHANTLNYSDKAWVERVCITPVLLGHTNNMGSESPSGFSGCIQHFCTAIFGTWPSLSTSVAVCNDNSPPDSACYNGGQAS